MKKQKLHDEDVLFYHSLVQRCVALVVRDVNGGPMLETETIQSKGMLKAINAESRWVFTIKFFQLFSISEICLKMLALK